MGFGGGMFCGLGGNVFGEGGLFGMGGVGGFGNCWF